MLDGVFSFQFYYGVFVGRDSLRKACTFLK